MRLRCFPACGDAVVLEYDFDFADTTGWQASPSSMTCGHLTSGVWFDAYITVGPNADADHDPYNVVVHALRKGELCSSTTIPIEIIPFDADMDSDNTGPVNEAPSGSVAEEAAEEQGPGKIVCPNRDDDNGDGIPDNQDNVINSLPDRQDIAQLLIRKLEYGAQEDPHLFLEAEPAGVVRVFEGNTVGAEGIVGASGLPPEVELDGDLYKDRLLRVEGLGSGGMATITLRLKDGEDEVCTDVLNVTVPDLDLDADSDNTGGPATLPDGSDAEDLMEEDEPGKWIYVNDDDDNNDGELDSENDHIDGPADRPDIGRLVVAPLYESWPAFADPQLFVEVDNVDVVRVFSDWRVSYAVLVAGGPNGPSRGELIDPAEFIFGKTLGFEGVAPGVAHIALVLEEQGVEVCRDEVLVTVGGVDLDVDANYDGEINDDDEEDEEDEPRYVGLNSDDDNENDQDDVDDTGTVAGEDELVKIVLTGKFRVPTDVELSVDEPDRIKVWRTATKGTEVVLPYTEPNMLDDELELWVEGTSNGLAELTATPQDSEAGPADKVDFQVIEAKLEGGFGLIAAEGEPPGGEGLRDGLVNPMVNGGVADVEIGERSHSFYVSPEPISAEEPQQLVIIIGDERSTKKFTGARLEGAGDLTRLDDNFWAAEALRWSALYGLWGWVFSPEVVREFYRITLELDQGTLNNEWYWLTPPMSAYGDYTVKFKLDDADIGEWEFTLLRMDITWRDGNDAEITEPNEYWSSDTNPPPGPFELGVRYFPGATTPSGPWNDTITLRVETAVPLLPLYLKAFDPDDPSANDPLNVVDEGLANDLWGNDNRDTSAVIGFGGMDILDLTTDETGVATAQFRVAHQPGDNHRVAVSLDHDDLAALMDSDVPPTGTNPGTDDQVQGLPGRLSPLLTIWRKLHVEVDSMRQETTTVDERKPDWDLVHVLDVTENGRLIQGRGTTSGDGGLASAERNHYEGGTLQCPSLSYAPAVIASRNVMGDLTLLAEIQISSPLFPEEQAAIVGENCTLRDDDPAYHSLPYFYPLDSDVFIREAYNHAFIDPVALDATANTDTLVDFDPILTDLELQVGVGYDDAQNVWSADKYWAALLVMCHQPKEAGDMDADQWLGDNVENAPINPYFSDSGEFGNTPETDDNASVIFVETIRDVGAPELLNKDESHVIAHEIGHSAGPNTLNDHDEGGIMTEGAPSHQNYFTRWTLLRFRRYSKW